MLACFPLPCTFRKAADEAEQAKGAHNASARMAYGVMKEWSFSPLLRKLRRSHNISRIPARPCH